MHAFKVAAERFEYSEILTSDGRPESVNFARRNRTVTKVWTHDPDMNFTWTPDQVFINGPSGTEVVVFFTIR